MRVRLQNHNFVQSTKVTYSVIAATRATQEALELRQDDRLWFWLVTNT